MTAARVALQAVERALAALTYDHIERRGRDGEVIAVGEQIPLLQRSIAQDLRHLERVLSIPVGTLTLLSGTAQAIDDALTELEEARMALMSAGA